VAGPAAAPAPDVVAAGCSIRFGARVLANRTPELIVRVAEAYAPGATVDMPLYDQADGDGSDPKLAWEERKQPVGADGSHGMALFKPADGSLDRSQGGWTARFVTRTPAGAVLQDRTEWVPHSAGNPR
jgi:hypothetical protein